MCAALARLLILAALPALTGRWCAGGEVVSVTERLVAGGVSFAPHQRTELVAAVGQAATLECRVLRLGDKSVSWVRSSDLQILTHAGAVFTADSRVSATSAPGAGAGAGAGGSRHTLRIERLRLADGGRYECQVNTEPKMSLFFNLTVLERPLPSAVVSPLGARFVSARAGAVATLACEARYEPPPGDLPLPSLDIRWWRDGHPLDLQSSRGGVSLDTERWRARAVSRLTLAELRADDAGEYACAAGGMRTTFMLHLGDDDVPEGALEMQRDETAAAQASAASPPPAPLVPALVPALVLALVPALAAVLAVSARCS